MTQKNIGHDRPDLRKQAEEIAKNTARRLENLEISPDAVRQMLHELHVHRIELELQNDELRRTQAELETSRTRYFDLYDLAPVGYFSLSDKGMILEANLTVANLLALTRGSLFKQPLSRFVHSEDMDIYYLHVKQLFKTNQPQVFEIRMLRKDAAPFWARLEAVIALDADGLPICRAVMSDITRQKQAENALKDSETKNKALLNAWPDLMFLFNKDGIFLDYHAPETIPLLARPEFFLGRPIHDVLDPDIAGLTLFHIHDVIQNRKSSSYEYETEINGEIRCYESRMVPCLENTALAIVRDITERKQAEAKLRKSQEDIAEKNKEQAWLLKSMMNAFVIFQSVLDDHGRFVSYRFEYINDAYEKITGKTLEQVLGKTVHEVWPETEASWIEKYGSVAMTGIPLTFDMRHQPTGKYYHCYAYRPWETTERFCVIFDDITEQELAANENKKLQDLLTQAQKMESIGRLAGGVAHDFNNMLSIIMGFAEMTLDALQPSDPLHENIQEILSAGKRSSNVVRQLLAFARKQTVAPKVLDLNDTVEDIFKMLRRLIGEDIDLLWKPAKELWPIKMDSSQFEQLLANLVLNARDAIKDVGKITIETTNARLDPACCETYNDFLPGEYVLLTVSDNGCGMDKEVLAHIFEPFFTTKELGKGTGLGLATAYGIVKQNNGFINAYSEMGQGSTFNIYLPRYQATEGNKDQPALPDENFSGSETVLLVEDEKVILKLGKAILERIGYTVLTANTPEEAIRLAGDYSGEIHLLMTDVVMPEMNGRDLARKLTAIRPKLITLFMSGYTGKIIAHHGVLDDGVYFIQKPFSKKDLAVQVRKALSNYEPDRP